MNTLFCCFSEGKEREGTAKCPLPFIDQLLQQHIVNIVINLLFTERKTYAHEPDLQDLLEYLESDDVTLIVNAANYLQHLSFSDDQVKIKVRYVIVCA